MAAALGAALRHPPPPGCERDMHENLPGPLVPGGESASARLQPLGHSATAASGAFNFLSHFGGSNFFHVSF